MGDGRTFLVVALVMGMAGCSNGKGSASGHDSGVDSRTPGPPSPADGGADVSPRDGATMDAAPDAVHDASILDAADSGVDASSCTPDDLTCEAGASCCSNQCVQGVCCFQSNAGACATPCVASGSGLTCLHDYDCCGAIFGSTCHGGACCNAPGQLCNGNNAWCCSGVCDGSTCN